MRSTGAGRGKRNCCIELYHCEVPLSSANFSFKFTYDVLKNLVPQEMFYAKLKSILVERGKKSHIKVVF